MDGTFTERTQDFIEKCRVLAALREMFDPAGFDQFCRERAGVSAERAIEMIQQAAVQGGGR